MPAVGEGLGYRPHLIIASPQEAHPVDGYRYNNVDVEGPARAGEPIEQEIGQIAVDVGQVAVFRQFEQRSCKAGVVDGYHVGIDLSDYRKGSA